MVSEPSGMFFGTLSERFQSRPVGFRNVVGKFRIVFGMFEVSLDCFRIVVGVWLECFQTRLECFQNVFGMCAECVRKVI